MNQEPSSELVICTYRVDPSKEADFRSALSSHWPTLRKLDLVTERTPQHFRSLDGDRPTYVEIFEWVPGGAELAHDHPDVIAIWEPLVAACESRDGRPAAEFPHYEALAVL